MDRVPLKPLHPQGALRQPKLTMFRKLTTEELIRSLCPGEPGALKVKLDGTIMDGHHRVCVLRERGVEVDACRGSHCDLWRERSILMKAQVYWVTGPWPGRLGILPRPRGGDWLADEVRSWREAGIDVVVSLLAPEEVTELELQKEEARSLAEGLEFHSFPIPDYGVPRSGTDLLELVKALERDLESGKSVGVHCRQGIGRSSIVAASLFVLAGEEADEAFRRVERARDRPVPDTAEQREWVAAFALDAAKRELRLRAS